MKRLLVCFVLFLSSCNVNNSISQKQTYQNTSKSSYKQIIQQQAAQRKAQIAAQQAANTRTRAS